MDSRLNLLYGFLLGGAIPSVLWLILWAIFDANDLTLTDNIISALLLFGFGISALLVRYYFRRAKDYMGRGIMMAMFVYLGFWLIQYGL